MTTLTLTPAKEAFVELSEHCVACPDCRPDPERPQVKRECTEAGELYRVWFGLWREEVQQ
ncbi:hypothetical protein [Streptomyces sp. NPDC058678]|uniref:hypothetical protein n=1 Tax=Streptomyces sp. NPDC058678 TaxID=3346595 RepID=UPI003667C491